ncbi:unnamed protein product [Clonostachys rosea]|uniref:PARP catalytic domain-containing protein n=1 Tax=Bionectria ochroleuca TaxID=29856 RepID=A0ABY6TZ68_BIOOC|nr:unnamed protein product [Clonostachys rosea]
MGYRKFKADLAAAKEQKYDRISRLRGGDSEGEIIFLYQHDEPVCQVEIQISIQDVENYPDSREVLLFTASDDVDQSLIGRLQNTAPRLVGKSIHGAITEFLRLMSTSQIEQPGEELCEEPCEEPTEAISRDSEDELTPSLLSDPWGESDLEMESDVDAFDDDHRLSAKVDNYASVNIQQRDATEQQRKDLLQAMRRGFSVGVYDHRKNQLGDILSLAVKVSELGLTDNGLAWGLKPTDYFVMLLRFPHGYPSPSEYQSLRGRQSAVSVRFGKCCTAKPSKVSAQAAFDYDPHDTEHARDAKAKTSAPYPAQDSAEFIPLHLFSSITKLLNKDFPIILRTRRDHGISWSAAQILLHRQSEGAHIRDDTFRSSTVDYVAEAKSKDEQSSSASTHSVVSQDDALSDEENFNIPLVLMQFALQSVLKSGKFCINCHEQLEEGFEAAKPYVCSRPLCLHQYFSSGLGPSIEHDILTAPYVVDLLVSFFYAAVMSRRVREMPTGLGLKTFRPGTPEAPGNHHKAEVSFETGFAKYEFAHPMFHKGERLLMIVRDGKFIRDMPILSSLSERHLCEVTEVGTQGFSFNILQTWKFSVQALVETPNGNPSQAASQKTKWVSVYLFRCIHEFDDLDNSERDLALPIMACGIPPVAQMREFLQANPSQKLSSWSRIDHPSYKLLHWIVASNRSLIAYDDHGSNVETPGGNKVIGMEQGWMQFRFLQGSPEKELRFTEQIVSEFPENQEPSSRLIPTLFAFHGSPLGNWHSIIRSSLDHTVSEHGRAYGNGVYLSNKFETSSQYCKNKVVMGLPGSPMVGALNISESLHFEVTADPFHFKIDEHWPHSVLKVASAIAICEVVNRPAKFVSMIPHYVVQNIDWIQCRYLFVKVEGTVPKIDTPVMSQNSMGYLRQDANRKLHGKLEILIPASAIPVSRLKMYPHLINGALPSECTDGPSSREDGETFQGQDLDGLFDSSGEKSG